MYATEGREAWPGGVVGVEGREVVASTCVLIVSQRRAGEADRPLSGVLGLVEAAEPGRAVSSRTTAGLAGREANGSWSGDIPWDNCE